MIPGSFQPKYKHSTVITNSILRVLNRYNWIKLELVKFRINYNERTIIYEFTILGFIDHGRVTITEKSHDYYFSITFRDLTLSKTIKFEQPKPGFRRLITSFVHRLRMVYEQTVINHIMEQ